MSTIAALADAVAAHVNAGPTAAGHAVRMYQPAFTLEDLKDLRVSVVPARCRCRRQTRDSLAIEYVVDVGVQKKAPRRWGGRGDRRTARAGRRRSRITCGSNGWRASPTRRGSGSNNEPVVSSESLEQHRVFTSVLSVTYRVRR